MSLSLDAVSFVGAGLNRPECVIAHASGWLFASDWTPPGGVTAIAPDGAVTRILATDPAPGAPTTLRPNGVALEPDGAFLLAHLGDETGGVYRLHPSGRVEIVADQLGSKPLPPANFVWREPLPDGAARLWLTVSTTVTPRARDYRPSASSGFIARIDPDGAVAIAADGLGYANECVLAPDGGALFVNETFARRLTAYEIRNGRLSAPRLVAQFGEGDFPDGVTLTEDGGFLVTSIVSNRVLRVAPDGRVETLLEDADPDHVAEVERAFQAGEMGRPHLDRAVSRRLRNISSLAFGGPTLDVAYLGCLLGEEIARFDAPFRGVRFPWVDTPADTLREVLAL